MTAHPWHHWELERIFAEVQSQPSGLTYAAARQQVRQRKKRAFQRLVVSLAIGLLVLVLARFLIPISPLQRLIKAEYIFFALSLIVFHGIVVGGLFFWTMQIDPGRKYPTEAVVRRDNRYLRIPIKSIVEGDVVWLSMGQGIPGNVRLVAVKDLQIGQVTEGRWQISTKDTIAALPLETPRSEHSNMVYAGSEVIAGEGLGVVVQPIYAFAGKPGLLVSLLHQEIFKFFQISIGLGCLGSVVLFFRQVNSFITVVVFFSFVATIFHGMQATTIAQKKCCAGLESQNSTIRFPGLVDTLSRLDTIVLQLNSYFSLALPEINIAWRGILHGSAEEATEVAENLQIPVQPYIPGLALPPATEIAICCQTEEDIPLIAKASIVIASRSSAPVVQSSAGVILPENTVECIVQVLEACRVTSDRVQRIVLSLGSSSLAFIILVILTALGQQPLKLWTVFWLGSFVPCCLGLVLLQEPPPVQVPETPFLGIFHRTFYRSLFFNTLLLLIPPTIAFLAKRSTPAMAWDIASLTFTFSLIGNACSLVRLPLLRFPWLLAAIGLVVIGQVILLQVGIFTQWFGITPIDRVGWAIAILLGSTVFWIKQILRRF